MKEAIIIITTDSIEKKERFCGNDDEWTNCWGLDSHQDAVLLEKHHDKFEILKIMGLDEIKVKVKDLEKIICWIDPKKINIKQSIEFFDNIKNFYLLIFHHSSPTLIPNQLKELSIEYSLSRTVENRWKRFVEEGKILINTLSYEKFENFFEEFSLNLILEELKFIVLELCLKIEGLEKCFLNSGENSKEKEYCLKRLAEFKIFFATAINNIKKIKEQIIERVPRKLEYSLNNFYNNISTINGITKDNLGEIRILLCNIIGAIKAKAN